MPIQHRFEFKVEAAHQREAIIAASQSLSKGRGAVIGGAFSLILTVLAALGGMTLARLTAISLDANTALPVIVGWFMGGGLYLVSSQIMYSQISHKIAKRRLHQAPQIISFDDDGVTYEATPALWTTPWALVDEVIETKTTITIMVSGISFTLPKTAVGDARAVNDLLTDLEAQLGDT